VLEDKSGQSHEELWKIYRKMYMTRRVEDTWYNKGE
jgi:TPP-dependent pyruvate/acetoin dehydrogenase alpha subunit